MSPLAGHPFLLGFPPLPQGGTSFVGTILGPPETPGTARAWTDGFLPIFSHLYGVTLEPGSLNLRLPSPVEWEDPYELDIEGRHWEFCPVVLEERQVGVAYRMDRRFPNLIEIVSVVDLRRALGGLPDGARVAARLLPGWDLRPAA
ncbi:MAG TPA: hypothetical protein VEI47_04605 [Gemmatimonadales bacterium]|nr:hypothetical protein [Gemmatimonadales bacterium]